VFLEPLFFVVIGAHVSIGQIYDNNFVFFIVLVAVLSKLEDVEFLP
jgi:Kef-type K+ transport system membrane component KefB